MFERREFFLFALRFKRNTRKNVFLLTTDAPRRALEGDSSVFFLSSRSRASGLFRVQLAFVEEVLELTLVLRERGGLRGRKMNGLPSDRIIRILADQTLVKSLSEFRKFSQISSEIEIQKLIF